MRTTALLLLLVVAFHVNHVDGQVADRDLLDESSWPQFVQDRGLPLPEVGKDDARLPVLLVERYNATLKELRNRYTYWLQGSGELRDVADTAQRLIKVRREVGSPAANHVKLLEEQLEFAKTVATQAEDIRKSKRRGTNEIDKLFAESYRLTAEVELHQARKQTKSADDNR